MEEIFYFWVGKIRILIFLNSYIFEGAPSFFIFSNSEAVFRPEKACYNFNQNRWVAPVILALLACIQLKKINPLLSG
ncbi:MAG TPA: hypothetical protein DIT25_02315 [Candidatus Moranbacteria bacterium]|nr:hypothetical protein [Candidatus Moranbacteria bacterium]